MKRKKKKRQLRLWVSVTIFMILFGILSFSLYNIYQLQEDKKNITELTEELEKDIDVKEVDISIEDVTLVNPPDEKKQDSDYWYYIKKPFAEVDFTSLLEKNSDTVAFLRVENTNINYPVVQTNNNEYYLKHAFNKSKNSAGWVFLDYRNNINDLSDNTIIYGHGRHDTTMFGTLKNVLDSSWQSNKDNYVITVSTPKENMLFQIFSIYTIEMESYYITSSFVSDEKKEEWLQVMKKRNIAPISTDVTVNDKILTLSTCQNNYGGRVVVHAKLIKKMQRDILD